VRARLAELLKQRGEWQHPAAREPHSSISFPTVVISASLDAADFGSRVAESLHPGLVRRLARI
jgi:hypothetical protein